jgi:hypothetical protein
LAVRLHPHAAARATDRGATEAEIVATVEAGERFPAKHGRTGFRRNFPGDWPWRGKRFGVKQVEVYAVVEGGEWLAITVLVKFF